MNTTIDEGEQCLSEVWRSSVQARAATMIDNIVRIEFPSDSHPSIWPAEVRSGHARVLILRQLEAENIHMSVQSRLDTEVKGDDRRDVANARRLKNVFSHKVS